MRIPRERLEELWNRLFFKGLDALHTAALPRARSARPHTRYERARTFAQRAAQLAPRLSRRVAAGLWRLDRLPFAATRIEELAYGSGGTVYRVETAAGTFALKINRDSLGRRLPVLRRLSASIAADRARAVTWFGDVVLAAQPLFLHAPLCGVRALADLQPFLEQPFRDVFSEIGEEELVELAREHRELAAELLRVARESQEHWQAEGSCADLVGHGNLVVCSDPDRPRLRLLDVDFFRLQELASDVRARHEERLQSLARIAGLVRREAA